jgi:phage terminase large subunit
MPLHERKVRWVCLVAHRRAGKTVAAVNELIKGAIDCDKIRPQLAYIAPFRDQGKKVAWEYLKTYSEPLWEDKPNESELTVKLLGGARISVYGADNPDALRGIYLDGAFLDEFGDFRPSVWGNVIRPALSDRGGWAVFGGTPKGRNEFWQIREMARKSPETWKLIELRSSESNILPPDEIAALKLELTDDQFAQEFECDFAAALPGAYFGREMVQAERDGRITAVDYDDAVPVYTAWDIGYRDDTAIWWFQVIRNEIHVLDYHASSGQTIEHYAKEIHARPYKYATHWLPHDARAKTLASGGKSIIEQLASHLSFNTLAIVPSLDVQDGIQAARRAIGQCWFDEAHCYEGLEALRQYQREYDEDKKAFREKPRHDWTSHPADAFRMLAVAWRAQEPPAAEPAPMRGLMVGPQNQVTLDELYRQVRKPERRI